MTPQRTDADWRVTLSHRLTAVLAVCLTTAAVVYSVWSYSLQMRNMNDRALSEARTLAVEVCAAWDYVNDVQHTINYNDDGSYDFKGVYCSIAGKNIAQRFTSQTDGYAIRFVRENPRSPSDAPDEMEARALAAFSSGELDEYYQTADSDGPTLFYLAPLTIEGGCLTCHGDPAGQRDETGFVKEGMQVGDLAGAVSIAIPLDAYVHDANAYAVQTVAFFLVLVTVVTLVARHLLKRWALEPLSSENQQLQEIALAKSSLVSTISHELRTPLASIIAFTDLWAKSGGKDPERERELVGAVKKNSEVLLEMVNNTIDIARIEAGRYELADEQVDVDEVVGAVASVAKPLALEKGLELVCRVDPEVPVVVSDWEALRKILTNLTGNALKYTDRGSVRIHVGYDVGRGELVMEVADTGVGIRCEDFDAIFEVFSQGGEVVRGQKRNGSGLGLGLVRNLAEMMGGSVKVASELGRGSTFIVRVKAPAVKESEE